MRIRLLSALMMCLALMACDGVAPEPVGGPPIRTAAGNFLRVVSAVEPAAERECRARAFGRNCDFLILVDDDPRAPANAYQSIDANGRPVITMTLALIRQAANADELAFVMSHEAAHHILNHLGRRQRDAEAGAVVLGGLASLGGGSSEDIEKAQRMGAALGARKYSKEFELEADQLGTVIAYHAGFDPLVGAGFFTRIPDPGDRFLGTHPPNADRVRVVQQTAAALGLQS